jgi:hypothetical protein
MTKFLIFTDSRGEHKATFRNKHIFTERITRMLKDQGIVVDKMCCPFSRTTTMDFIEIIEKYCLEDVTIHNGSSVSKIPYFTKIDFDTLL